MRYYVIKSRIHVYSMENLSAIEYGRTQLKQHPSAQQIFKSERW